jgi:hypothetical protein
MDRDLAEHLAKDTGLRPEEIDPDIKPASEAEVVQHLAEDTGLDAAELKDASAADPVDAMVGRLPID